MAIVAVVFPGQGSQYVGMGQAFFEASQQAREVFAAAGQASGLDIGRLCFEGPMDELTQTVNLQPAVVAVDLVCWQAIEEAGIEVKAVAGHSLGEYPALVAAGAMDAARCLELVSLRGRLMDRDATARPGAMAALMGLSPEEAADLCVEAGGVVQPANFNTPVQTVITGEKEAVAAASALAKERGKKAIPLKVSGAWHSPLMEDAGRAMTEALRARPFTPLSRAVVPNTTGRPTRQAREAHTELMRQLTSPVRWVQSVQAMLELGVDTFVEAGPKTVLSGLIKKIAPESTAVLNVENPEGLAALREHLGK